MKLHVTVAFACVGRAVLLCQQFETSLAPIYEFFKMNVQPDYFEKTGGFVPDSAYKNPLKNILKELIARNHIDAEIESRIDRYIEDRHLLVHRWLISKGWADEDDIEYWKELENHSNAVAEEAQALTHHFSGYLVKHAEPGAARQNPGEYRRRMACLFREPTRE